MNREAYIGRGLFEAAKEEHVLDRAYDEITGIRDCFADNPEFLHTLRSPFLSVRERIRILDTVLGASVHLYVLNALKILYENKAQCSFEVFVSNFLKEYEREKGILRVKAYSARAMSESEEELLRHKLEVKTGKTVILQLFVDEKMIGGLKYEYEDVVFDGGISGNLLRLREMIAAAPSIELDKGVN